MAERGLQLTDHSDPEATRGLEEMRDFYAYWETELPALLKRWDHRPQTKRRTS